MEKVIITAFSDTHSLHHDLELPKSDILIFAGDMMTNGYREKELIDFLVWYGNQLSEIKILVAGNHDRYLEMFPASWKEILKNFPIITYLENSGITVAGLNIWGTPDTKEFCEWAFNKPQPELNRIHAQIPDNTNILVSHGAPYGTGDTLRNGQHVGEISLTNNLQRLKKLKAHIFGHIHEGYGQHPGDYFIGNASVVNERYDLVNEPLTFELYG